MTGELQELGHAILRCKEKACPYRHEFSDTYYGTQRQPYWFLWWENEFLSKAAPRPSGVSKYIPFRYDGNSKTMIIALRPSTEDFPSNADVLLAEALIENKLARLVFKDDNGVFVYYEGAFLTDVINCRGLAKTKIRDIPISCRNYLSLQLELIRPDNIVFMGKQTKAIIKDVWGKICTDSRFSDVNKIPSVSHYSYAFKYRKIEKFKEEFRNALATS